MCDFKPMQVMHCVSNLPENPLAHIFIQFTSWAALLDVLVQVCALYVIHHDADLPACLHHVVHLDDIWVLYLPKSHQLSLNRLLLHRVLQPAFFVDFYGKEFAGVLVLCLPYDWEGTLPNDFTELVVSKGLSKEGSGFGLLLAWVSPWT